MVTHHNTNKSLKKEDKLKSIFKNARGMSIGTCNIYNKDETIVRT